MPYSAQQHGSVALSRSQELSSTSYRIETGLKNVSRFCYQHLEPSVGHRAGKLLLPTEKTLPVANAPIDVGSHREAKPALNAR